MQTPHCECSRPGLNSGSLGGVQRELLALPPPIKDWIKLIPQCPVVEPLKLLWNSFLGGLVEVTNVTNDMRI